MKNMNTPWGRADYVREIGNGILSVSTPSHGGYYVPPAMVARMPEAARATFCGVSGWFEEDCDWALVAMSFPELFPPEAVGHARRTVACCKSAEVCAAFGIQKIERW